MCLLQILQQLDGEGKGRVVKVLKELPKSSVLVVGQADSFVTQHAACVHVVKKQHGRAFVVILNDVDMQRQYYSPLPLCHVKHSYCS